MARQQRRPVRMLRLKEVIYRTGLSSSTIYNKLQPSSSQYDPDFPRKIRIGGSAVAWVEEELEHWLMTKRQERN